MWSLLIFSSTSSEQRDPSTRRDDGLGICDAREVCLVPQALRTSDTEIHAQRQKVEVFFYSSSVFHFFATHEAPISRFRGTAVVDSYKVFKRKMLKTTRKFKFDLAHRSDDGGISDGDVR